MSYYTEGYVSKINISCNQALVLPSDCPFTGFKSLIAESIAIEPTQPFKIDVGNGSTPLILFMDGQEGNKKQENSTGESNGESKQITPRSDLRAASTSFTINVDAQFLLSLKLNHTKVQFEVDLNLDKIETVTVI